MKPPQSCGDSSSFPLDFLLLRLVNPVANPLLNSLQPFCRAANVPPLLTLQHEQAGGWAEYLLLSGEKVCHGGADDSQLTLHRV